MTGKNSGLIAKLKSILPNISWTHCFLHRQALAAKVSDLNSVLKEVIKIVNSIRGKALQTRLFRIVCEDMGSLHQNLLYHTEVKWVFKGKVRVLTRVLELRAELLMFLQNAKSEYAYRFSDSIWLLKLAFLADLFSHLNNLNKNLQGRQ